MTTTPIITKEDTSTGGRFVTVVDGHQAVLTYIKRAPDLYVADHTGVPAALEGRGVGKALFNALVADAQAVGYRIDPQCWFVALHAKRRPELLKLFV